MIRLKNALVGLAMASPALALSAKNRPNIIFFLIDDNGWTDSQVAYGEEVYPFNTRFNTPNMVALSQKGVIMTSAYACPLSTPTRTSILTGAHAAHERITSFTSTAKDTPTDASGGTIGIINENLEDAFARSDWNWNGLSPVPGIPHTYYAKPFVQILKDSGYFTIHIGKAHWGSAGTPGASPYNMGFVVNVSGQTAGYPRSYQGEDNYGNTQDLWRDNAVMNMTEYYGTETHLTDALTKEALKSLDYPIQQHQPFYLYMSHYATHTPIQKDVCYYQKYIDAGMDNKQACYASLCEGVDASLGKIMDYLDEKGVADNTIIILYADNGGHSANTAKGGIAHTQNAPLREGKSSVYEGGVRVPMLVYWPGKTRAGIRINTPVMAEDFFPTILEMAETKKYSVPQEIDGESWVKLVTKGAKYTEKAIRKGKITDQKEANRFVVPKSVSGLDPERAVVSHFPHQWRIEDQDDIDFMSAVRAGPWKLVYRMHNYVPMVDAGTHGIKAAIDAGALELYNLDSDISERRNIASVNEAIVTRLSVILSEKLRSWNAPMPICRKTGRTVPLPDEL